MRHLTIVADSLPAGFDVLETESIVFGHTLLSKLRRDWPVAFPPEESRVFAVTQGNSLLGIGGIAPDPYQVEPGRARIRHLYVSRSTRRLGVGSDILRACLEFARERCHTVSLRTPGTVESNRFYEGFGFCPLVGDATASHVLVINKKRPS